MSSLLTALRRSPQRVIRAVAAHYRAEQAWRRSRHAMAAQEPIVQEKVREANALLRGATDAFMAKNFHAAAHRYELAAQLYEAACAPDWASDARMMAGAARCRLHQPVKPPRPILVAVAGEIVR